MGERESIITGVRSRVEIKLTEGTDAITRITGPGGDEWRKQMYPDIHTREDVLEHFAYNAVANGITDACELDGWADLTAGEVTFTVYREGMDLERPEANDVA